MLRVREEAKTNKSDSLGDAGTTSQVPAEGGQDSASGGEAGTQTAGAASSPSLAQDTDNTGAQKLYVDGREVDEKSYFAAAGDAGYDVQRLRDMNYRPAISTKEHGDQ